MNVAVETGGPASGKVPKAVGAPGGGGVEAAGAEDWVDLRQAERAAMRAVDARFRKRRREFGMTYCSDGLKVFF
jgi:hypothetical protein